MVDEGGVCYFEMSIVVNLERRFDKWDGGFEGRVGDGLVVGDYGVFFCWSIICFFRMVGFDNVIRNKIKKNVC